MTDLFVSGNVLRWARESYGITVAEAADFARAAPEDIESWETGKSSPRLAELKRLATAYRRQLATLLLRDPPAEDEPSLPDFRKRIDYVPPRLSPGMHLAIREVRHQQLALRELAPALGLEVLPIGSAHRGDAEALAASWRERLGISVESQERLRDPSTALRAWRDVVESAGTIVLQLGFGEENVRGFSMADLAAPAIALNSEDSITGRIFTLFHELAHLLTGEVGICAPRTALRFEHTAQEEERFCNRFAGALLVPSDALSQREEAHQLAAMPNLPSDSDFRALREVFKVSSQVLWYRLRDAGLVQPERYFRLWELWAGQSPPPTSTGGRGQDRAQRAVRRYGRRFVNAMLQAETRGYVAFDDILNYTRVQADQVAELAELAARPL